MENKEIIVDGVDVSGCQYYKIPQNEMYPMSNFCGLPCIGFCKNDPKCSYKQWKRKEQECEELKIYIESNEQQVKEVETLVMDNDRLINELDQLKSENKHLNDLLNQALKDYEKTRETLTEIKEIGETCSFTDSSELLLSRIEHILQKISECEVE